MRAGLVHASDSALELTGAPFAPFAGARILLQLLTSDVPPLNLSTSPSPYRPAAQLAAAGTQRDALEKELQGAKRQVKELEGEVQVLTDKSAELEAAVKSGQEALNKSEKQGKEGSKKVASLEKKLGAVQGELDAANKAAEDTRASLGGEAAQLSATLETVRLESKEIAAERDGLRDKVFCLPLNLNVSLCMYVRVLCVCV